MKTAFAFQIVLVTAPNLKAARKLARAALDSRTVACASLVPGVESHYWWRGKIETGKEVLLILKAPRGKVASLEKVILAHHPYDTPEILALPLTVGTERYLAWIAQSCE